MNSVTPARLIETHCQINESLTSSMDTKTPTCQLQMTVSKQIN